MTWLRENDHDVAYLHPEIVVGRVVPVEGAFAWHAYSHMAYAGIDGVEVSGREETAEAARQKVEETWREWIAAHERITKYGSGNVFRDMGFPDWEIRTAKADISIEIGRLIREAGAERNDIADAVGISKRKLRRILKGGNDGFDVAKLEEIRDAVEAAVGLGMRP